MYNMMIGERIKKLRETKNITQTELATIIGTTKQNIYKYETGVISNIPYDKIEKIADYFKVSPAYLMGWEDIDENSETIDYFYHDEIFPSEIVREIFDVINKLNFKGKQETKKYVEYLSTQKEYVTPDIKNDIDN